MKKIILFIARNVNKIDVLHGKITAGFNLWNTIYEAIKPLLPAQASEPAPLVAPEPAPAAEPAGEPVEVRSAAITL